MKDKVAEINLELGMPRVEEAILRMKNALTSCKGQGYRGVILIHGYGASGVGGAIKAGVIKSLGENSMRGIVREYVSGENWHNKKKDILSQCPSLKKYEKQIAGNEGITVVLLR